MFYATQDFVMYMTIVLWTANQNSSANSLRGGYDPEGKGHQLLDIDNYIINILYLFGSLLSASASPQPKTTGTYLSHDSTTLFESRFTIALLSYRSVSREPFELSSMKRDFFGVISFLTYFSEGRAARVDLSGVSEDLPSLQSHEHLPTGRWAPSERTCRRLCSY